MSDKRNRKEPERFIPWQEGEKHVPMALRKDQQKLKQKAYQKQYREKKKLEKENKAEQPKSKKIVKVKILKKKK